MAGRGGMRFARVPTGRETCGWCYMLASRGFGYTSAQAASAGSHEGCDCLVVPGADGKTVVEGYDPEWMRSCWSDCVSTVANDSLRRSARAEWDAMAPREREAYRAALGKEPRAFVESASEEELARIGLAEASRDEGGFWRFYAERAYDEARREVERRDPRWLYGGSDGLPVGVRGNRWDDSLLDDVQWKRLKPHEKKAWDSLANQHGIIAQVLPEIGDAPANIDAMISGQYWELKSPGNGKHAIDDMTKNAVRKWKKLDLHDDVRLIISASESDRDFDDLFDEALRRAKWYGVSELLVISRDGSQIYRLFPQKI